MPQHRRQFAVEEFAQFGEDLPGLRRRACPVRLDAAAQAHRYGVVALQVGAQVGQLHALLERALGEDFLAGQQALAHALAEGMFLYMRDALEAAFLLQFDVRVEAQQVLRAHHAVEGRQLAAADLLLQRTATG